jgi:hypothetical protein
MLGHHVCIDWDVYNRCNITIIIDDLQNVNIFYVYILQVLLQLSLTLVHFEHIVVSRTLLGSLFTNSVRPGQMLDIFV